MTTVQISPQGTGVANGAGTFSLGMPVPQGTKWQLAIVNVRNTSTVALATATISRGSASGPLENIDQLQANNNGTTGKVAATPFYAGQWLWIVWTGCDPGATCVLQAYGVQRSRSDPDFDIAAIGDGFPSIPPQLIVGSPPGSGAPGVYIGPVLPAPLATLYASLTTVSRFNKQMSPDGLGYWYEIVGTFIGPRYFYAEGWVNSQGTVVEFEQTTTPVPNSISASTVTWGANSQNMAEPFVWRFGGNQTSPNAWSVQNSNIGLGTAIGDIGSLTFGVAETHNGTAAHNNIETWNAPAVFLDDITGPAGALGWGHVYSEARVTSVASGAVAGTETLMFTTAAGTPITFVAGRAYRVSFRGIIQSAVVQNPLVNIRKTNLAGTLLIGAGARSPIATAGNNLPLWVEGIVVNTSGVNVTTVLALTATPQAATLVNILGGAGSAQAYWDVEDIGTTAQYSGVSV